MFCIWIVTIISKIKWNKQVENKINKVKQDNNGF